MHTFYHNHCTLFNTAVSSFLLFLSDEGDGSIISGALAGEEVVTSIEASRFHLKGWKTNNYLLLTESQLKSIIDEVLSYRCLILI